jgi:hypothetical protein
MAAVSKELLEEMINSGLMAIMIKVIAIGISHGNANAGLKSGHLGKTLGELQPTLFAPVGISVY